MAVTGFNALDPAIVNAKENKAAKTEAARKAEPPIRNGYVGSESCARCHQGIYTEFLRTRMGRSLTRVTPDMLKSLELPGTFRSDALDRSYEVFVKDGKLYQSEYQSGANGQEVFRNTQQIEWIVGAGMSGFSTLIARGDRLFQAPLSYYSKPNRWELSPGYETNDLGFNRPVDAACLTCHTGRTSAQKAPDDFDAVSLPLTSIGCENCHGPGAAHLHAMSTKGGSSAGAQIVNPDKLNAELENDICMSCHESGDSHALKPGKSYADFRPGAPLDDTLSILMVPLKRDDADKGDHVQHYYEMSMSRCFRASAGQLRCATCHDPHVEPAAEDAPAYFNGKCMVCHTSRSCTAPAPTRQATAPADNCIGCHMPQRDTPAIAHTSLTNHRILARPGEPWPAETYRQTTKDLPDLVHVNRVEGRVDDIPLISLLQAYGDISERRPEYIATYDGILSWLEGANLENAQAQQALGRRDLKEGNVASAIQHLNRSLALDSRQPMALSYLSQALAQAGRVDEAVAAAENAVNLDPWNELLQKALIDQLIAARQYDKAQAAMEHYMDVFPEDGFMRQMLSIVKQ